MAVVTCPHCGAKNRVDERRAADSQPVCGKCAARLPPPSATDGSHPVTVTDDTFARDVLGAGPRPVLVDAWAPWCGPCRMIAPTLDELAAESGGRYTIAKLNVDENPRSAAEYRIEGIPTLLLFKNGKLVDRIVGLAPKPTIAQKLAALA